MSSVRAGVPSSRRKTANALDHQLHRSECCGGTAVFLDHSGVSQDWLNEKEVIDREKAKSRDEEDGD